MLESPKTTLRFDDSLERLIELKKKLLYSQLQLIIAERYRLNLVKVKGT